MKLFKPHNKSKEWPKVRSWTYTNGSPGWVCDARPSGKRTYHSTKAAADAKADEERIKKLNATVFESDGRGQFHAKEAWSLLQKERPGVNLVEAVQKFISVTPSIEQTRSVSQVIDESLKSMEALNRRPRSIKDFRIKINKFKTVFGDRMVSQVSQSEIEKWINGLEGIVPKTREGYQKAVSKIFEFSVRREYILKNPVAGLDKISVPQTEVGILTVEQVKAFMNAAVKLTPDAVPSFALNVFAGLRPEAERFRLDWKHIKMDEGIIKIHGSRSKNSMSTRNITMRPNLIAWLNPYAKASGPIGPAGDSYYTRKQICQKAAGIEVWVQDVLRHTYASMLLADCKNPNETAMELGHSNTKMLESTYRALVTPKEAAAFWQIYPESP